jgi:hypothetical protein
MICPLCQEPPLAGARRQRRQRLVRQIYALRREILALQQGRLQDAIQHQTPAPACTICGQAAPGKPGQPTPTGELVHSLQRRLDELERELNQLNYHG